MFEVGGYRVLAPLGRGATAVVYEAQRGSERVALKVALPGHGDDERWLRGPRAQARLRHPAIVRVLDVGTDPAHGPWVAMDLVPGTTLRGPLTAAVALRLLADVAAGLDAAHAAGVVHRDVKPANVLVADDRALLADFGLAREGGIETTERLVGTLPYLAPEVVRGGAPSAAADRYALAAIAYELLVGEVVFPRMTDAAVLFAHVDAAVPAASTRRPELPPAVDAVLARGLAKDPAQRPETATALIASVSAALGPALATLAAPPTHVDATTPTADAAPLLSAVSRRPRARLVAAAVAGVAVLAIAGALALGGDPAGPASAAPLPRGHIALGSALTGEVVGRDCRDRAPSGSSPSCTVLQTELPGRTLVVPRDGAVRAWTVRGAHGELVLQVLRRRDGQIFQVVRSQPRVAAGGTQRFAAALPARAGDVLALAVLPGGQVGVVPGAAGAATERWTDPVSADRGPGATDGFAHDVQLQVDFEPGALIPPPAQVTGPAAKALGDGREVAAGDVALPDGRRVRVALVEAGGAVHVDLFRGTTRRARILVPDLLPGGTVVEFKPFESAGNPSQLNVAWRNPGTRSDVFHYFGLDAEALEFYS